MRNRSVPSMTTASCGTGVASTSPIALMRPSVTMTVRSSRTVSVSIGMTLTFRNTAESALAAEVASNNSDIRVRAALMRSALAIGFFGAKFKQQVQ